MRDAPRSCPSDGALVSARHEIPDDATDLDVEGLPTVGCNRLRCARCDALVGHSVPTANAAANAEADDARRYACGCSQWTERGVQPLDDDDPESFRSSPAVPWRCAGHPRILLPHDIDGARVVSRKDLEEVVHRALADGQLPPRARAADRVGTAWLARLHQRLRDDEAALVVDLALASLVDPSAATRSRALSLCASAADLRVRERVLELLVAHRGLFEVDDDLAPHRTLEERAWELLAPLVERPGAARDRARADALAGRGSRALFSAIAAGDPAWFYANAVAMARATPARAEELHAAFAQLPDDAEGDFRGTRDAVRKAIADTITLEEALARTLHPVLAWDHHAAGRACVFEARTWGAALIKAAHVPLDERAAWDARARAHQGRVGATHGEGELVWVLDADRAGLWDRTRELVRGDATRLLLQGGFVPTSAIARVLTTADGVRAALTDAREVEVHERDPRGAQPDAAWAKALAADLAAWLGVPCVARDGDP